MEAIDVVPKRWTREEYEQLIERGIFVGKPRVELIEGQIIEISPQNNPHSKAITRLNHLFVRAFGETHYVRVQCPMNSGLDSQPEPDFCILRQELVDESDQQPSTADLVVEVSHTTVKYDRKKARLYAASRVPEYWIVNLEQQRLEVYRELLADGYGFTRIFALSEEIQPVGWPEITLKVSDLF